MLKQLKVVFLGSGPIAVPIMEALYNSDAIELMEVVTQPDRPAGRKRVLTPTPLGSAALALGAEPLRVPDVNAPEFLEHLAGLEPDMLCVVSFGQILKSPLLALPRCGCVNVHASLLPLYRGASPITQALLNGDSMTGVAFMEMEKGLDSGPVYRTEYCPLDGTEYADGLELKLGRIAADVAAETLCDIAQGKLPGEIQDKTRVTVCRKISKRDGRFSWSFNAAHIERMTRAFFPWPGAVCDYLSPEGNAGVINICKAAVIENSTLAPGECADIPGKLIVGCGENTALEIIELIPSGAKRMNAAAFRNGLRGRVPLFPEEIAI
ncbi:MAG: methionyl-tRNA formyltransferase [Lentisphaeria bacterium]|nr:methionyl-tRNA formyltransferase [Lentisphaeria bacterium]